jgi:hypothetical protein
MATRDEQIGESTGHDQAMRVFFEPAIAHLGKAKHSLDNPDCVFDLGPHFGFGAVFGPLDRIDNPTVTAAAIGEIPCPGRMLPDHRPLAAIRLVAPHAGFVAVQQICQSKPDPPPLLLCEHRFRPPRKAKIARPFLNQFENCRLAGILGLYEIQRPAFTRSFSIVHTPCRAPLQTLRIAFG